MKPEIPRAHPGLDSPAAILSREILDRIGDKWTLLIIYTLGTRPMRFSELKRQVAGISQKMLSQTLRGLERDGIVRRTVLHNSPPAVEYALEPLGRSLHRTVSAICDWAADNVADVERARALFDERQEEQDMPSRAA